MAEQAVALLEGSINIDEYLEDDTLEEDRAIKYCEFYEIVASFFRSVGQKYGLLPLELRYLMPLDRLPQTRELVDTIMFPPPPPPPPPPPATGSNNDGIAAAPNE